MTPSEWATTSWSSRAIRSRSSAAARSVASAWPLSRAAIRCRRDWAIQPISIAPPYAAQVDISWGAPKPGASPRRTTTRAMAVPAAVTKTSGSGR